MTWNYRIFRHEDKNSPWAPPTYALHEVFYNDKGQPTTYATEPDVVGDDVVDIISSLQLMLRDAKKHRRGILRKEVRVIDEKDFKKGGMYYQFMIDEEKEIMKDIESCLPLPQSSNANRRDKGASSSRPKGKPKKRLQGKGRN